LNETDLHDLGQYNVRNQIAECAGATRSGSISEVRQIMVAHVVLPKIVQIRFRSTLPPSG